MMRWNGFGRSIVYAVLVALAAVPWWLLARPVLGARIALATCLIGAVAVYLAGLVTDVRRRLAVGLVAALAGAGVALAAHSAGELAVGLGVVLAVGRSGVLFRAAGARGFAIEAGLVAGGLVFARFLAGGPLPNGLALALWGFFLVQSLYFLIGGVRVRRAAPRGRDPFVEAHARALALLEGRSV